MNIWIAIIITGIINYLSRLFSILLIKPEKIGKKSRDLWLKYYNPLINVDKILKIVNC